MSRSVGLRENFDENETIPVTIISEAAERFFCGGQFCISLQKMSLDKCIFLTVLRDVIIGQPQKD